MRRLSTALTSDTHQRLAEHLLRADGQEDICFALSRPSSGLERDGALLGELILPKPGDRHVHGNASFTSQYFLRALATAEQTGAGLVLAHSHPRGRGWQNMSRDDIQAERGHAAQTWAMTGRPLIGLTLAGDGSYSARSWQRTGRQHYERCDHESVRVLGERLAVTFHPRLMPSPVSDERMIRTLSAWGELAQADLARLRVAIVGAGSVGMLVAETLTRIGVRDITIMDFDSVKLHNLDRLAHATQLDALLHKSKVEVARRALTQLAPVDDLRVRALDLSVVEPDGLRAVLDCDIAFSCVDRPWPRQALDHAAFAHLIPVIDGGIAIAAQPQLIRADWKAHIACPARRCLSCIGQYLPSDVALERAGDLDDPTYIAGLPADHRLRGNENVYAFSTAVASLEVLQCLSMVLAPMDMADVGDWNFHFVTGRMDVVAGQCEPQCPHQEIIAVGDQASAPIGAHPRAAAERTLRAHHRARADVRIAAIVVGALARLHASAAHRCAAFLRTRPMRRCRGSRRVA